MRARPRFCTDLAFRAGFLFATLLLALWWAGVRPAAGQTSSTPGPAVSGTGDVQQVFLSAGQAAQIVAGVSTVDRVELSPDGMWIVYSLTDQKLTNKASITELLLQRMPLGDAAISAPVELPRGVMASSVRWCPNSRCISMIIENEPSGPKGRGRLVRYDVATAEMTPFPLRDASATAGSPGQRPRVTVVDDGYYQWSPHGRYIAFTAPLAERGGLDPRRGVPSMDWKTEERRGLFLLEVATGIVTQLTPDSLQESVHTFDWAPDENALAVAVKREGDSVFAGSDLIVVERSSGAVRTLVTRPGMDAFPHWSPDGQWIAFGTHNGDPFHGVGWPAVVPAKGGPIITFPKSRTPMTALTYVRWAQDSSAFYYTANLGMTSKLVRADVTTREATQLSAPGGELPLPHDRSRSLSADGRRMAYVRESLTTPPEIFVVELDAVGRPTGMPRQLTRVTPDFPIGKLVHAETLNWPSPDGKFTIHGLLLAPATGRSGGRVAAPLPTLLFLEGGPGMVSRSFAHEGFGGALLALAARGYAVLVPNTRGRGGYGETFNKAIGHEKNRARGPYEDAMAGLDLLIKRGLTDPAKLGVLGHSYGGYLTAYIVTQTTRFKGAVIHEGTPLYLMTGDYYGNQRATSQYFLSRDLFGIHNPFDPAERARLIAESPGLNADRVKTPTLLQFGAKSAAERNGLPLFNALRRFNVPCALFVYEEGHNFLNPANIADDLTRTAEWLDYWVRGIPFPDAERAKEYNEWRTKSEVRK